MQPFTLIKLILVFFFLARQIRLLITVGTGSHLVGALVGDFAILCLGLFYVTYYMGVQRSSMLTFDKVKILLLAILLASLLQGLYFAEKLAGGGWELTLFRSFGPFRKIFFPLILLFFFSYLLNIEFLKNGDLTFKKLVRLFTIFLYVAVAFNFGEFMLRSASPALDSFYVNDYVRRVEMADPSGGSQLANVSVDLVSKVFGLDVTRVFGIGLDMHLSGAIIFICYLVRVFLSGKFRLFSVLNFLVFLALLLSGSRMYIAPFVLLNAVIFIRQYGKKNFLSPIFIAVMLIGVIYLTVRIMISAFTSDVGYFLLLTRVIDGVINDPQRFIFGQGPVSFSIYVGQSLVESSGELQDLPDFGWLTTVFEIGLVFAALFAMFHFLVLRRSNMRTRRQMNDPYIRGLKFIIVLDIIVFLSHYQILFDRTIIVFHVFFISLLYSWSSFRRRSFEATPAARKISSFLESASPFVVSSGPGY